MFGLDKPPSHAAISKLLRAPVVADAARARPTVKTVRSVSSPDIERQAVRWVSACERPKLHIVTYATIQPKAAKLRAAIMTSVSYVLIPKLERLQLSLGWVQKLLQRNGLIARRV